MMAVSFALTVGFAYPFLGAGRRLLTMIFALGALLGAIGRDIGLCRRYLHYWPLHQRVLDWGGDRAVARGAIADVAFRLQGVFASKSFVCLGSGPRRIKSGVSTGRGRSCAGLCRRTSTRCKRTALREEGGQWWH